MQILKQVANGGTQRLELSQVTLSINHGSNASTLGKAFHAVLIDTTNKFRPNNVHPSCLILWRAIEIARVSGEDTILVYSGKTSCLLNSRVQQERKVYSNEDSTLKSTPSIDI